MDALILSCGTGGGHNSAATAIKDELIRRGHCVQMLDPYTLTESRLDHIINQSYIKLVQKAPYAFGCLYFLGNIYRHFPFRSPVYHLNGKMSQPILQLLQKKHFDIIIMPHIFPGEILTHMKNHGISVPKTLFIATDYTCIPFTEETDCDYYVIPSADLKQEFIQYGIPEERLYPLGIPVQSSFETGLSRELAIQHLGLDPQKHYLLIFGGSMGAGKLLEVISILYKHFCNSPSIRLIVICGSNQTLYQRLKKKYQNQIQVTGHTSQMADYMKACDVIISKLGGLSSTEAAVSGSPLIHISPIPGCESHNMKYFSAHGMSIAVRSPKKQLISAVESLMTQVQSEKLRQCQHSTIRLHAANNICDLIESAVKESSYEEKISQ